MPPPARRLAPPLVLLAGGALVAGVWSGLLRLGWALPLPGPGLVALHGPLLAGLFVGTLVAIERAVALGRPWAWAGPLLLGLAGPALLLGGSGRPAALLATLGGAVMAASFAPLLARARQGFLALMAVGAACHPVGSALWLAGQPVHASVPWWAGFVVLTVAGERWERSRIVGLPRGAVAALWLAAALSVAGMVAPLFDVRWGLRPLGAGFVAVAAWMLLFDVAWRSARAGGLRGFVAAAVLAGHAWLLVGGVLALLLRPAVVGPSWDAVLHPVFVGFLFCMVFGHAPIVFPAVIGRPIPYHRVFWAHLVLLQVGLALRLFGDLAVHAPARRWGGLLNAAAIVLFAAVTAASARRGARAPRPG